MQITAKVYPVNSSSALKAFASVIIDDAIQINGYKVLARKDGSGFFVGAPSQSKEVDGETKYFDDVIYLDWEENGDRKHSVVKEEVEKAVLAAFEGKSQGDSRQAAAATQAARFSKTTDRW